MGMRDGGVYSVVAENLHGETIANGVLLLRSEWPCIFCPLSLSVSLLSFLSLFSLSHFVHRHTIICFYTGASFIFQN